MYDCDVTNMSTRRQLWDAQTGQELATLNGHDDIVYSVAFSPDSKTLASGGSDKTIKLWVGDARQ